MVDVFISYSRTDTEFVRELFEALTEDGRDVWVDFDDIPYGTEFWNEIELGIERAAACIFVISPPSVESYYCSLELAEMVKHNKKIVPIVATKPDEELLRILPDEVRSINWIYFDGNRDFDDAFKDLLVSIDTDFEAARQHTQLLVRALQWQREGHKIDFLARGKELASFIPMIERDDLSILQESFLEESLRAAQNHYNYWRFVFGFVGGLLAMACYIALSFRSPRITPLLVTNVIAAGEVFGLFTGGIALFGAGLPEAIKRRLPNTTYIPIRIVAVLLAGMLTWMVYQWFFLNLPLIPTWASLLGGIGISIGFVVNSLFKPPAWFTFLLSFAGFYLAIFFLNDYTGILDILGWSEPLIYFDTAAQVYWIGIPMALLYALGTNAYILWQSYAGDETISSYLRERTVIFNHKRKRALA